MRVINRDESKMKNVPSAIPMICALDLLMCFGSAIAFVVMFSMQVFGNAHLGAFLYIPAGIFLLGVLFGWISDHYYNWYINYSVDLKECVCTYSLNGGGLPASNKTTIRFKKVDRLVRKKKTIKVFGEIEKVAPRKGKSALCKYEIPAGFSSEQLNEIYAALQERMESR